jgi:hypothetical protein
MKALCVSVFSTVLTVASTPAFAATLISFDTMYGVDGPFLQHKHSPIRGVRGDELPWEIESAQGSVDTDGHVVIHVRGLVFADDDSVPVNLRGKNDASEFRALVSCITELNESEAKRAKVLTPGFPATESGDSDIDATVELPNPCIAPVVFVLPGDEKLWFAVTGFESEEGD